MGLLNYFFNLYRLKAKKKLIGKTLLKWSSRFNLKISMNWVNWFIIIVYLSGSFYLITSESHQDKDYFLLVVFVIILSFYPRWHIIIGSKGIILGMKTILWSNQVEREIIDQGKFRYLELKWASDSKPAVIKTKRIQIPLKDFDF